MLKKQYRLKNRKAIDATYNSHQIVSNDLLVLYVGKKKTDSDIDTKFAFVVSKKYHKRAVKRNRIKRLLRESIRLLLKNQQNPQINQYLSFIFIPKQDSINKNFADIDMAAKNLLEKAIQKF